MRCARPCSVCVFDGIVVVVVVVSLSEIVLTLSMLSFICPQAVLCNLALYMSMSIK